MIPKRLCIAYYKMMTLCKKQEIDDYQYVNLRVGFMDPMTSFIYDDVKNMRKER